MNGSMDGRMDDWDVLLVNCFNSADIKLSIVSSHRTPSSSHHIDNHHHLIISVYLYSKGLSTRGIGCAE